MVPYQTVLLEKIHNQSSRIIIILRSLAVSLINASYIKSKINEFSKTEQGEQDHPGGEMFTGKTKHTRIKSDITDYK